MKSSTPKLLRTPRRPIGFRSSTEDRSKLVTPRPQAPYLNLLAGAIISTSVLITLGTFALSAINFIYLESFAETLGFAYSDFDISPQELPFAAWEPLTFIVATLVVISCFILFFPHLFLSLSSIIEFLWRKVRSLIRKTADRNRTQRHFLSVEKSVRKVGAAARQLPKKYLAAATPTFMFFAIVFLLPKGTQSALIEGEKDALHGIRSGPVVTVTMADGSLSEYTYVRRLGDKIIVAPSTPKTRPGEKRQIVLLRRSDVVMIKSTVDVDAKIAEFNAEVDKARPKLLIFW